MIKLFDLLENILILALGVAIGAWWVQSGNSLPLLDNPNPVTQQRLR